MEAIAILNGRLCWLDSNSLIVFSPYFLCIALPDHCGHIQHWLRRDHCGIHSSFGRLCVLAHPLPREHTAGGDHPETVLLFAATNSASGSGSALVQSYELKYKLNHNALVPQCKLFLICECSSNHFEFIHFRVRFRSEDSDGKWCDCTLSQFIVDTHSFEPSKDDDDVPNTAGWTK